MNIVLAPNAPKTSGEAFAYVSTLQQGATAEDLKILALTEAMGKQFYDDLADLAENARVKELLRQNGIEELKHAHRVSEVIEILTGEPFPIPSIERNPIYTPLDPMPVTREALSKLAQLEFDGEALYAGIAASFDDPKAIALLLQNGKEEPDHGRRLLEAIELLPE